MPLFLLFHSVLHFFLFNQLQVFTWLVQRILSVSTVILCRTFSTPILMIQVTRLYSDACSSSLMTDHLHLSPGVNGLDLHSRARESDYFWMKYSNVWICLSCEAHSFSFFFLHSSHSVEMSSPRWFLKTCVYAHTHKLTKMLNAGLHLHSYEEFFYIFYVNSHYWILQFDTSSSDHDLFSKLQRLEKQMFSP